MSLPTTPHDFSLDERSETVELPFPIADPSSEFGQRSAPVRNLETVNYVTVEIWRSLRIPEIKTGRIQQDLSMLPNMQVDIVLEVLGYLHPLELIQVSRTSRAFRELLHSTDPIWRTSFLTDDRLPQCPPQIPGRRWVKLLFGPKICDICGQPNTDADYIIWRRVCIPCMDENLLDVVPGYTETHELNSAVHRTRRTAAVDGPEDGTVVLARGKFWRSDGGVVAELYEALNADDPDAAHRFLESQRVLVSENYDFADKCEEWAWQVVSKPEPEYFKMLDKVAASVVKRLIVEGFDQRDAEKAWYDITDSDVLWRMPRLTSRLWNRARPHILSMVIAKRTERLERERLDRIQRRKDAILAAALMALRTPIAGSRALYYPPPHTISAFPPIAQLIYEDSDAPLSPDDPRVVAALAGAPAFVDAWCIETKALLTSLLPYCNVGNPDFRLLERASSVFRLRKTNERSSDTAIGWDEARAHLHWCQGRPVHRSTDDQLVKFNDRGAAAAASLALLLGMDPVTTTAAQMDATGARFACATCPEVSPGRRPAMHWRECVLHVGSNENAGASHGPPSWLLLSPLAAADVRRREEPDDYSPLHAWACTLCNDHLPMLAPQSRVWAHLRIECVF
ncbi:hypothetical protein B0H13DRAFT_1718047 [Mycena leptocephala]|nr:hypothetical protein B0H13DRAFT_1718047 [Mycena leptocephala]